ncbi:MAG TPA: hypothetical protein VGN47_07955 [Blastococcus sp.]|nr:hypothetical protein [Blastococcus sp.]
MTATDVAPGRALIEAGEPVAGSMCTAAAAVVFESGGAVQVDPRLAAWLRAAATEAAELSVPRERVRAGAALAFAVEHGVTLSRSGRALRSDAFFAGRAGARPAGGEVIEGAITAARFSVDERRVRHLGYLLAEVAHSPDIDADLVARAQRLAAGLSRRQLAFLAGVGRRERIPLPMAPLEDEPRTWSAWGAREDLAELQRLGLLDPPIAAPRAGAAALPRLRAADLRLTRRGVLVHRLLCLDVLRDDAVTDALAVLGLPRS